MRALVAMSGGVDSSVAAALMAEAGHDVTGVTLKQWQGPDGRLPTAGCCTVADAEDARRVAAQLDVPYYVLDYVGPFREAVVEPFADAYASGRTPNPCIECNRRVRFQALLDRATEFGCDVLVTGHHARVMERDGRFLLLRGRDAAKDQSYVLHMLGQEQLARVRLPIGALTKDEVRAEARRFGLRTADKPDSQEICFVASGDYRKLLAKMRPETVRSGPIVDTRGNVVGEHEGTAGFTIGQRKGLRVAAGGRRYVVGIDSTTATITVGELADLERRGCVLTEVSWVAGGPPHSSKVEVKVRYRAEAVPASITPAGPRRWDVLFDEPQSAIAPGQSAVMYRGDEVLGGGIIAEALAA